MIYVTGDCHADFHRFNTNNFPDQKDMTKDDYVIICGDFGGVWSDDSEQRYYLDWLDDKNFTTLFVDGNHENHWMLNNLPVVDFHGGKAHKVRDSVYHLMRGYVFDLCGKKFFAFGGASSHDIQDGILDPDNFSSKKALMQTARAWYSMGKMFRIKGMSWWPEELPNDEEMQRGRESLEQAGNDVDYVISHCLPQDVVNIFSGGLYEPDVLTMYFNTLIMSGLKFNKWYAGHYHMNQTFMCKFNVLYERIERIE